MEAKPARPATQPLDPTVPDGQDAPSDYGEGPEAPGTVGRAEGQARHAVGAAPPTEAEASAPPPTVTKAPAQAGEPEGDAGEPEAGSRLGRPSLVMLADAPLTDDAQDRLGFPAYADALAGLLDHPDTDTPLTIAISAPWGAGKTSLANMVIQRLLDRPEQRGDRPHIVCWFNAWLHDDAPHLGAAFAAQVAKTANQHRAWPRRLLWPLPSALLSPEERWHRRILLALGTLTVAVLVALLPGMQAAVKTNASTVETVRAVAGERWASLALVALVALVIWRKLFAAVQATARFVDDPKSEAATGSMRQVREQLGKLIQQATRNPGHVGAWLKQTAPWVARFAPRYRTERRRLVLVVDDLERCRPPRAVEVCEVASQLLGHPDVVTILVADMSTVAASAEIKYAALETVAGDGNGDGKGDGQSPPVAKGAYGRRYLQKLVQIQFDLPPAALETLRGLLTTGPEAPPAEETRLLSRKAARILVRSMRILAATAALAAALISVRTAATVLLGEASAAVLTELRTRWLSTTTVAAVATAIPPIVTIVVQWRARRRTDRIDEEIKAAKEKIRPGATTGSDEAEAVKAAVLESEAAKQGGTGLASHRLERFLTDDSILRGQAESTILEYLPSMPRNAKRLLNHLRLLLVVASERKMLGGIPRLEAAHLGKWIVLLESWPELGQAVRADPILMRRLEGAVKKGVTSETLEVLQAIVRTVAPQVAVTPDLGLFLADEPAFGVLVEQLIYCSPATFTTA
jgi:hypothetical protein